MFDDAGGYGGGGFDTSGFGNGETPQAEKKGSVKTERIVPVTVRQINECPDTGMKLYQTDMDVHMVKIIGIVKKIVKSSLKIIYTVQDNTGSIEGIHWLEADLDEDYVVPVMENTYCGMIGVMRHSTAQHSQKHLMVFKIYAITDLNEVTAHTLQILYISLKSEEFAQKPPQIPSNMQEMSSIYGGMDTSDKFSSVDAMSELNPPQKRVMKAVMQVSHSQSGASVDEIMDALQVKMPKKELEKILEYLTGEGHCYNTQDDKHFKATDYL